MAGDTRRTRLADAAITTLAREGGRGLTHRAVDRTAGVPEGSTSYYFRTRLDLLRAIVRRMSDLDAASLPALSHPTGEEFAETFTAVVHGLLTHGRDRQLARYELTLEGIRRPELRQALLANTAPVHARLTEQLAALGVPDPADRAQDLLVLLDGLLLSRLTAPDGGLTPPSMSSLRRLVGRLLQAVDVPLRGATP
ncbi:TetR/AcrR family transcriptional regulator [Modestobacter sp. I12A-02662]|uniref:TetR/AcrR family transcriptional regulator n=1 Tax=Modestobacter sp. I12A-02662 TaxID=1730496 RepID=UPI0034DEA377